VKRKKRINVFKKAPLGKLIKTDQKWNYYFCGITINQCGFGIVWREKNKESKKT